MLPHARNLGGRLFPHGWQDVVLQILLFAAAYYAYRIVRGAADGRISVAFEHARQIISIERTLHVFVEPAVQGWATGVPLVIDVASWLYINSQFVVTLAALAALYLLYNECFYFVRNMFMVAMGLALLGYTVFPTAPPRFFPEWGFTDSVASFTHISPDSVTVNALFNPYAAVPSMHVAFALMIGIPLARLVRRRALKIAFALYPVLITFVVIATGNHFIADAVLGALTAGISALAADRLLARARPHRWAFSPTGAGATA
jgi:membrane-associated phospholipid phosphatase